MPLHECHIHQVSLLMDVLVDLAKEDMLALKGGTAINLFYRDMPRLSVDIDLAWLPVEERSLSLKNIDQTLRRIMTTIINRNPHVRVQRATGGGDLNTRLFIKDRQAQIKLEINPVIRGAVYPPEMMRTSHAVMEMFGFAEMKVLSFEDLYGGKLCATLDRQHPRDLFDIKLLYENEGLTDKLFRVLMVYVASSKRPAHELLRKNSRFDDKQYNGELSRMMRRQVTRDELIEAQTQMYSDIRKRLTGDVATFLLSLHDANPDFGLIGLSHAAHLPAVRWKLINLEKLKAHNFEKHAMQRRALEELFSNQPK